MKLKLLVNQLWGITVFIFNLIVLHPRNMSKGQISVSLEHFEACSLCVWFKILPKNGWSDAGHEQFFVNMSVPKPGSATNSRRTCYFTSFFT